MHRAGPFQACAPAAVLRGRVPGPVAVPVTECAAEQASAPSLAGARKPPGMSWRTRGRPVPLLVISTTAAGRRRRTPAPRAAQARNHSPAGHAASPAWPCRLRAAPARARPPHHPATAGPPQPGQRSPPRPSTRPASRPRNTSPGVTASPAATSATPRHPAITAPPRSTRPPHPAPGTAPHAPGTAPSGPPAHVPTLTTNRAPSRRAARTRQASRAQPAPERRSTTQRSAPGQPLPASGTRHGPSGQRARAAWCPAMSAKS